jgi:hypothetical protein
MTGHRTEVSAASAAFSLAISVDSVSPAKVVWTVQSEVDTLGPDLFRTSTSCPSVAAACAPGERLASRTRSAVV